MTNRERARAILHYEDYDRMPVVHFGYWDETLEKWRDEGHLTPEEVEERLSDAASFANRVSCSCDAAAGGSANVLRHTEPSETRLTRAIGSAR